MSLKPIVLALTAEQIDAVAPFMVELRAMSDAGKPGICAAQVFLDHIRIGLITNEEAVKITSSATLREAPEWTQPSKEPA